MWIEIYEEGKGAVQYVSPSARKVWIEIYARYENDIAYKVTFRKEGVD